MRKRKIGKKEEKLSVRLLFLMPWLAFMFTRNKDCALASNVLRNVLAYRNFKCEKSNNLFIVRQ